MGANRPRLSKEGQYVFESQDCPVHEIHVGMSRKRPGGDICWVCASVSSGNCRSGLTDSTEGCSSGTTPQCRSLYGTWCTVRTEN